MRRVAEPNRLFVEFAIDLSRCKFNFDGNAKTLVGLIYRSYFDRELITVVSLLNFKLWRFSFVVSQLQLELIVRCGSAERNDIELEFNRLMPLDKSNVDFFECQLGALQECFDLRNGDRKVDIRAHHFFHNDADDLVVFVEDGATGVTRIHDRINLNRL